MAMAQAVPTDTNGLPLLLQKIQGELQAGHHSEADLAPDLKQFDALLAAEKGQPTETGAHILFMKALLYADVLDSPRRAKPIFWQIKTNYPNTTFASKTDGALKMMDREENAKKKLATLVPGAAFPDFKEKDVLGQPLSVAQYRGKVVLLDFWATWCPPCRAEIPNVVAAYAQFHDKGLVVIGVSLDQDKDKLLDFIKVNNMTWPQYFDGLGWENKLANLYGIESIPATILIDGQGKIIARDVRGEELKAAVGKALGI
jgi:peroxiredoxin